MAKHGFGGKGKGAGNFSKKSAGGSAKIGKSHKMFGKEMSPAGKK